MTSAPYSPLPDGHGLVYILRGRIENGRVAVQLVDAANGAHLWAQTYTASSDDLVTVIASEIQSPLLVAVKQRLRARPILSLRPWELNLLVTWVPGGEGAPPGPPGESSFWLQKRALEIDPDYAPAHATFAEMLAYHALFDPRSDTPAAAQRARDHADRALQLAPYDAEVLYHVATYYRFTGDRERATALLQRVLALQPSYLTAQADLYFVEGQCQADNTAQVKALNALNDRLSPANPARWLVLSHLADLKLGAGEARDAAELAGRSRDVVTTTWSSLTLAAAKAATGDRTDLAAIAHEHDAQWTHLDYNDFADRAVARWCLNGPATPRVQADFRRLGAVLKTP
ncbi:MAG: hypothetical protein JF615_09060 [Asticcacaulis sp.]|nr:hypothetical protein [Asticcacaulis sp.]